jgi:hypothetical protein
MMALMIVNVDGLKLGGQLDRETSLVAFSYIVYFVHCAFSMLSENKFYLLTYLLYLGDRLPYFVCSAG